MVFDVVAVVWLLSLLVEIDWLHGGAEAFLTLSNTVLVIGLLYPTPKKG